MRDRKREGVKNYDLSHEGEGKGFEKRENYLVYHILKSISKKSL